MRYRHPGAAERDIIVFHGIRMKSGYAGPGFSAAKDMIPDIDPHDAFMDVYRDRRLAADARCHARISGGLAK